MKLSQLALSYGLAGRLMLRTIRFLPMMVTFFSTMSGVIGCRPFSLNEGKKKSSSPL